MNVRWLLVCVPAAMLLAHYAIDPRLVFVVSMVAVVPLVELLSTSTERLSGRLGAAAGGMVHATLINLPEFIIGGVALVNGLAPMVKASLTGSILVNLLAGLGCALVVGGSTRGTQRFERSHLRTSGGMLMLCGFCFIVPAAFSFGQPEGGRELSREIAIVLLVVYAASLVALLAGRQIAEATTPDGMDANGTRDVSRSGGPVTDIVAIAGYAAALGIVSDTLAESLGPTAEAVGLSSAFSGVVLLGGLGGVGEVLAAMRFSRAGRTDLVLSSTVGSTIQIVLLVAPLLVLLGWAIGEPMNLAFSGFEVVAIVASIVVTRSLIDDGRVTWMEGVLLLAAYAILALGFYHLPDAVADADGRRVLMVEPLAHDLPLRDSPSMKRVETDRDTGVLVNE